MGATYLAFGKSLTVVAGAPIFAFVFLGCSSGEPPGSRVDGTSSGGSGSGSGSGGELNLGTGGSGAGATVDLTQQPTGENCGDGELDDNEACDDGNKVSQDGCFENCLLVEPGFICPVSNEPCRPFAKCGDGLVYFPEQCDDGGTEDGDGCSSLCKVEIGSKCEGEPSVCSDTTCGDGEAEGAEGCDDGNMLPFDGCDERCQWEPSCGTPGAEAGCTSFCGDGIILGDEQCDDGNSVSGDGCSEDCTPEDGYTCTTAPCEMEDGECVLRVAAVFRDFNRSYATGGHPDFEVGCGAFVATEGVVDVELDAEGKPVLADNSGVCISSTDSFAEWYRSGERNSTVVGELMLYSNGDGGFVNRFGPGGAQYENAQGTLFDGTPLFFPLDAYPDCASGETFGCALPDTRDTAQIPGENTYESGWIDEPGGALHNFGFTSEVSYWFEYDAAAPPTLNFLGDDDFWVFINGKLAVDLGGPHTPLQSAITLDAATNAALELGLVDGNVYPISVFHAERRAKGSSFQLTLSGFRAERSLCIPDCGDGVVAGSEECDDGVNDGGYNECQPGCVLAAYCGDGIVQGSEECDPNAPDAPPNCTGCRIVIVR